jgi:hypothetical protein
MDLRSEWVTDKHCGVGISSASLLQAGGAGQEGGGRVLSLQGLRNWLCAHTWSTGINFEAPLSYLPLK